MLSFLGGEDDFTEPDGRLVRHVGAAAELLLDGEDVTGVEGEEVEAVGLVRLLQPSYGTMEHRVEEGHVGPHQVWGHGGYHQVWGHEGLHQFSTFALVI